MALTKIENTDLELIKNVIEGDQSAFGIIVRRYESKVASTVFGMLGVCQEADDVGQEVFIRFYNSIGMFRGDANLATYLTRIAINLSLNELKKRKRRNIFSLETWTQNNINTGFESGDGIRFEKKEIVQKALLKIDPKHRSVIVLRLVDGYTTKETAEILKLPIGTVLSRLARGQKKMKKILAPMLEEL